MGAALAGVDLGLAGWLVGNSGPVEEKWSSASWGPELTGAILELEGWRGGNPDLLEIDLG